MSDNTYYIPILRWKAAEYSALKEIHPDDKKNIRPLIEFIMPQLTNTDMEKNKGKDTTDIARDKFTEKLPSNLEKIAECCGQNMLFIDTQLIDGKIRFESLKKIIDFGKKRGLFLSPVIYIMPITSSESDMEVRKYAATYAKESGNGLCIRITKSHLEEDTMTQNLQKFIVDNKLDPKNIDIIIDLKLIESENITINKEKIHSISEMHPWRTFAVASGAFPKDLTKFEKHDDHPVKRYDYLLWKNLSKDMNRNLSFSDYTIQHPEYIKPIPGANPSASVRYTLEDKWLIKRGEGLRNKEGAGHRQYLAHAQVLTKQDVFKGKNFSAGDAYIAEIAHQNKKPGNPKTWLQAGINHHITLTARQIAGDAQNTLSTPKLPA